MTRPVFKRFLPRPDYDITGTVYLVCTSAGEVGVNISADDLVCDLSPFDSMAQRVGRVNRFGKRKGADGSTVTVVHSNTFDTKKPFEDRRKRTLELLQRLHSVSPNVLCFSRDRTMARFRGQLQGQSLSLNPLQNVYLQGR